MMAFLGFLWKWAVLAGGAYTVFRLAAWNNARKERQRQAGLDEAWRRAQGDRA